MDINPIAIPLDELTIPQAIEVAVEDLAVTSERAISKFEYEKTFDRIERWSNAVGLTLWVEFDEPCCRAFIFAKTKQARTPALNTSRWRRSTINRIYAALRRAGYPAVDQTFLIDLRGGTEPSVASRRLGRPLTDTEIRSCELAADNKRPRHQNGFALACATADASETDAIRPADFDLDAGTVRIHGSYYRNERVRPLTPWGLRVLRANLPGADPDRNIVALGPNWQTRLAQVSQCLDVVLCGAGLRHDPLVQLSSVRAWAGLTVYDAEGLEAAAAALGLRSLDGTAQLIGVKRPRHAR
ncbi:MAG: hypothetical protein ABIP03_12090 [Aquihabitans sp.]